MSETMGWYSPVQRTAGMSESARSRHRARFEDESRDYEDGAPEALWRIVHHLENVALPAGAIAVDSANDRPIVYVSAIERFDIGVAAFVGTRWSTEVLEAIHDVVGEDKEKRHGRKEGKRDAAIVAAWARAQDLMSSLLLTMLGGGRTLCRFVRRAPAFGNRIVRISERLLTCVPPVLPASVIRRAQLPLEAVYRAIEGGGRGPTPPISRKGGTAFGKLRQTPKWVDPTKIYADEENHLMRKVVGHGMRQTAGGLVGAHESMHRYTEEEGEEGRIRMEDGEWDGDEATLRRMAEKKLGWRAQWLPPSSSITIQRHPGTERLHRRQRPAAATQSREIFEAFKKSMLHPDVDFRDEYDGVDPVHTLRDRWRDPHAPETAGLAMQNSPSRILSISRALDWTERNSHVLRTISPRAEQLHASPPAQRLLAHSTTSSTFINWPLANTPYSDSDHTPTLDAPPAPFHNPVPSDTTTPQNQSTTLTPPPPPPPPPPSSRPPPPKKPSSPTAKLQELNRTSSPTPKDSSSIVLSPAVVERLGAKWLACGREEMISSSADRDAQLSLMKDVISWAKSCGDVHLVALPDPFRVKSLLPELVIAAKEPQGVQAPEAWPNTEKGQADILEALATLRAASSMTKRFGSFQILPNESDPTPNTLFVRRKDIVVRIMALESPTLWSRLALLQSVVVRIPDGQVFVAALCAWIKASIPPKDFTSQATETLLHIFATFAHVNHIVRDEIVRETLPPRTAGELLLRFVRFARDAIHAWDRSISLRVGDTVPRTSPSRGIRFSVVDPINDKAPDLGSYLPSTTSRQLARAIENANLSLWESGRHAEWRSRSSPNPAEQASNTLFESLFQI